MANNKFSGYTPKKDERITDWESKSRVGNRLDRVNPYEFRKGMDYELTAIGCSRLAESNFFILLFDYLFTISFIIIYNR